MAVTTMRAGGVIRQAASGASARRVMDVAGAAALLLGATICCVPAFADAQQAKPAQATTPAPASPPSSGFKPADDTPTDVWIFSGALADGQETYSGTLVATKGDAEFELKLSGGATCDASKLTGEVGLVRLPEIKCSDDRMLRALFVPQGGKELKVFGHIGDQRFASSAHLLGTEPPPVRKQTAEPTVPGMERLRPLSPPDPAHP